MTDAELKARLQALIDTFVQDERAAVVAWLRSQVSQAAGDDDYAYDHAADVIERGDHRKEKP
jgi:hypothetical protein